VRSTSSRRSLVLPAIVVIASLTVLPGCDFNKTVKWLADHTHVCYSVNIPGSSPGNFPSGAITQYYQNKPPVSITNTGGSTWNICFGRTTPGGREHFGMSGDIDKWRINGCSVGVGLDFGTEGDGRELALRQTPRVEMPMLVTKETPGPASPNLSLGFDPVLGRVLEVENGSSQVILRIHTLEWAISTDNIPLSNLDYYDPAMRAMAWTVLVSADSPIDLAPNEVRIYDVPDDPIPDDIFAYARSLIGGTDGSINGEVAYKADPDELL